MIAGVTRVISAATVVARSGAALASGYLGLLTVAAWRARRAPSGPTSLEPRHRFTIVVPAHDEAQVIGASLRSFDELDYPTDRYSVHVVADNCTDGTAAIVASHGASVHERDDPLHPGKGPALEWLLERLRSSDVDLGVLLFIDADTVADPMLLRRLDDALAGGATVVQAHYAVREAAGSSTVALRAAAFAVRTYLRPLGRTQLGGTAGLFGNGMAFQADVLAARRWSEHLTEDAELALQLLLEDVKVAFAPLALVEAEMPDTLAASESQHQRWERGRIELLRRFAPTLVTGGVRGAPAGRFALLDAAVDLVLPPLSVVGAGTATWFAVAVVRHGWRRAPSTRRDLLVSAGTVLSVAGCVLSALRMVDAPAGVYRSLAGAPRFVAWKLGLWTRALARPVEWRRTARNVRPAGTGDPSPSSG